MRKFEIYNATKRNHKACAIITYDERSDSAKTTLLCNAFTPKNERDLPLLFELFANKGIFELDSKWTMRWIEDRIPPSGRQNIGNILRANSLDHYDPIELFAKGNGRSCQDDFLAREISHFEYEVVEVAPLSPCEEFGQKLKAARVKNNISQRELAELTGINQSVISKIESGHANPTLVTCDTLVKACGSSLF